MQHFSKLICAVFGAAVLLTDCTGKNGDPGPAGATGPQGSAGPNLTGNITGFVNPVDEAGAPLPRAGVMVTLEGTTPAIIATSDVDGRFTLSNVRSGTYNLTYSRTGLAIFRRFGLGHVGGDQPTYLGTLTMSPVATLTVPAFTASTAPSSGSFTFNLTIVSPVPTNTFRYALFASTNPNVSPATSTLLFTGIGTTASASNLYSFNGATFNRTTLTNAGFASGTLVYLAAFGSTSSLASYSDPATGRLVFPTLNPVSSPVATIIVP